MHLHQLPSNAIIIKIQSEVHRMSDKDKSIIDENDIDIIDTPSGNERKTKIVEEADNETDGYEKFCSICQRSENITGTLVDLPTNMCVCNDCMKRSFDMMNDSNFDLSKLLNNPNVKFMNISDMSAQIPKQQKVKKKKKEEKLEPLFTLSDIPAPHQLKNKLDNFVMGQDKAKKTLCVAVYNHYKRIASDTVDEIEIEKSNMLMIGPTGSGKTFLVRTLAKLLDVPLAIADATALTEAGYIGDDIESVLSKLLVAADNDVNRAEQGIVFIDEIDKIAKKKTQSNQKDVSGESVQQGLLKILEGSDVEIPVGAATKNAMTPTTTINTKNILFICGGAFPGLDEIIEDRLSKGSNVGFNSEVKSKSEKDPYILDHVKAEDLREYGMINEFLGRLPVTYTLRGLDADMLVSILREPQNAIIKQYQKLLLLDEVKLAFETESLYAIAHKAMDMETGARALRTIIEEFMLDIMYEIPKDDNIGEVVITKDYIEGIGGPRIILRG